MLEGGLLAGVVVGKVDERVPGWTRDASPTRGRLPYSADHQFPLSNHRRQSRKRLTTCVKPPEVSHIW